MFIIDNVLVTDEVIKAYFACNLGACKGACCIEGDGGAPLTEQETEILEDLLPILEPYLRPEGLAAIEAQGTWVEGSDGEPETPLVNGAECAYVIFDNGVAKCGIEKAWELGKVDFPKPISCHLYPIRIQPGRPYEVLRYHHWDICSPACQRGEEEKIPLYKFLKDALTRKYGEEWYEVLEVAVRNHKKK